MVAKKRVGKTVRAKPVRNGHGASQDDARARLIDAAIELFAKKGYEGTSVRDLATAAGVNVAAVSYYFGSKDELYHEALRACLAGCKTMRDLMEVHLKAARRTKTRKAAEDALRGCVEDFLHVLMSPEARHSHLVMREQSEGKRRFEPVIREFFQPVGIILREVILMLAPGLSDMKVFMVISGIIGQCLHIYKARVSYRVLAGVDSHSPEYIETVSKHIAHLTALGLRGLEREKGAS
jgi:TetR/AcrR family transcriptional regulator, regulator of cefoperazone and chloramphenicol sensitivity